jgi:glycosyltransferase 2 family protein
MTVVGVAVVATQSPRLCGTIRVGMEPATEGLSDSVVEPNVERPTGSRGRTLAMVVGTILAISALLSQVPSLGALGDTIKDATWYWIGLAAAFTLGNKVGYALALMGSVAKRLPLLRSVEAMLAAAFSNLAVPGIGGTAVQVRYLQLQGVDLASAVAAGAILANVANVVVQGALFLVALLLTSQTIDTDKIDVGNIVAILRVVVFLGGVTVAIAFGIPRLRRRTLPPTRRGWETVWTALRTPRQLLLLVAGNLCAAFMSALCLFACVEAFGGRVDYWPLLVANIVVGTIASLIPVPGGNTLVSAIGLSSALVAFGVSETVAVAAVLMQQLVSAYLPAIPGWFATNEMLRRGYL